MQCANPAPSRSVGVDVLRGIAVLAVVLCHAPFSFQALGVTKSTGSSYPPAPWPEVLHFGEYGVHLFLVISGFCIHMKWAKKADVGVGVDFTAFWKRRLIRLYPPYFVALLAALALTFVFHSVLLGARGSLAARFGFPSTATFVVDIVLLLLLMQNLTRAPWRVSNGPFWSLALEEQLYLLYFPALTLRRRLGWPAVLLTVGVVTLVWRLAGLLAFKGDPPGFWSIVGPAMWLPWILGAWAAEVYAGHEPSRLSSRNWAAVSVVGFGLSVVFTGNVLSWGAAYHQVEWLLDDLAFGASCFALLMAVVVHERTRLEPFSHPIWRGLARVGIWSYSIYLTHLLVMVPLKQLLLRLGMDPFPVLVLRIVVPIAAAVLFYRVIELPSHRLARRTAQKERARSAEAMAQ